MRWVFVFVSQSTSLCSHYSVQQWERIMWDKWYLSSDHISRCNPINYH